MNNQHRMKNQRQEVARPKIQLMSDREVAQRYTQELLKLKTLNQYGRHSERFLGYPNTLIMNQCKRELERRGLLVPAVNAADNQEGNTNPYETASDESNVSVRKDGSA